MAETATVARPYAEAVFGLAEEAGALAQWQGTLAAMAQVASHPEMRAWIDNPEISAQFLELKNAHEGVVEAEVRTAFRLDNAQLSGLVADLERRFKRRVQPHVTLDKELIGGVRVTVGDEVIDASVRGRLEDMAAALKS